MRLLLDTHAFIWLARGRRLADDAERAVGEAAEASALLVSPVSAWEIGLLIRKNRLTLDIPPAAWFRRALEQPGVHLTPLTVEAAVCDLPEVMHPDPADRLLVATARDLDVPLVTRDGRILDMAAATGHIAVIPC